MQIRGFRLSFEVPVACRLGVSLVLEPICQKAVTLNRQGSHDGEPESILEAGACHCSSPRIPAILARSTQGQGLIKTSLR